MKSTADRCLYRLIALPLFISIVSSAGIATAATKSKAKSTARVPATLEINRLAPVAAGEIDPASRNRVREASPLGNRKGREILPPAPTIEPFWSHPHGITESESGATPVIKKVSSKSQPSIKPKKVSTKPQPTALELTANIDRQVKPKPIEKKLVLASKTEVKTPAIAKPKLVVAAKAEVRTSAIAQGERYANAKSKLALVPKIEVKTSPVLEKTAPKAKPNPPKHIAANAQSAFGSNYLRLVRNPQKGTNAIGNPIYTLEAYVNGQKYQAFDVVSGTANTQNLDRHRGDSAAPLPDGTYSVSDRIIGGMSAEVGRTFISIFPRFETERSDLGIHLDPSFNKPNGYDGTAGCIGMTTAADRDAINDFVLTYRPRNLFVKITR